MIFQRPAQPLNRKQTWNTSRIKWRQLWMNLGNRQFRIKCWLLSKRLIRIMSCFSFYLSVNIARVVDIQYYIIYIYYRLVSPGFFLPMGHGWMFSTWGAVGYEKVNLISTGLGFETTHHYIVNRYPHNWRLPCGKCMMICSHCNPYKNLHILCVIHNIFLVFW